MPQEKTNSQILMKQCLDAEFKSNEEKCRGDFFERFAARQVLKKFALNEEEIESGLVGAGDDGGIDGVYVFCNKELMRPDRFAEFNPPKQSQVEISILQAKEEFKIGETPLVRWQSSLRRLLDLASPLDNGEICFNEDVKESFRMIRDLPMKFAKCNVIYSFRFSYVSIGDEVHPKIEAMKQGVRDAVHTLFSKADVEVEIVGADRLWELYQEHDENMFTLELAVPAIELKPSNGDVALVKLTDYYRFLTDNDGELHAEFFDANIRDYLGKNSVNSDIADTLASNHDEDFWWLNNGVTIVVKSLSICHNTLLRLEDPCVVNGMQTSNEIYGYFKSRPDRLDVEKRCVLVRIIVPKSQESRDAIILATNNQTAVDKSSLRVTDALHSKIEAYCRNRGLYYDRRKNYYKNQGKSANEIVSVSFLGQCLMTLFARKPDYARARPSTILMDDKWYQELYSDRHSLESYYKSALIGKKVCLMLRKKCELKTAEINRIRFHVLLASVVLALKKIVLNQVDVAEMDVSIVTDEIVKRAVSVVDDVRNTMPESERAQFMRTTNFVAKMLGRLEEEIKK